MQPDECVKIVVTKDTVPRDDVARLNRFPGVTRAWRTDSGLHVGYSVEVEADMSSHITAEQTRTVGVYSTFEPETGKPTGHRVFDVVPVNAGGIDRVGFGPDDHYAFAYSWPTNPGASPEYLAVGSLHDDKEPVVVELARSKNEQWTNQIDWDGEAFVVHAHGGADGAPSHLQVARVSTDGELLMPLADFGKSGSPGWGDLGHKIRTVPETGWSYVLTADGPRFLSAHDRSGVLMEGTTADAPLQLLSTSGLSPGGAVRPALGADSEALWVSWAQNAGRPREYVNVLQKRDAYTGELLGDEVTLNTLPEESPSGLEFAELLPNSDGTVTIVGAGWDGVFVMESDGESITRPKVVVDDPASDHYLADELRGFRYQDETWAVYNHGYRAEIVIIRIADGCVYEP